MYSGDPKKLIFEVGTLDNQTDWEDEFKSKVFSLFEHVDDVQIVSNSDFFNFRIILKYGQSLFITHDFDAYDQTIEITSDLKSGIYVDLRPNIVRDDQARYEIYYGTERKFSYQLYQAYRETLQAVQYYFVNEDPSASRNYQKFTDYLQDCYPEARILMDEDKCGDHIIRIFLDDNTMLILQRGDFITLYKESCLVDIDTVYEFV